MKYLIGILFATLLIGTVACGSDNEDRPVKERAGIVYNEFYVIYGSEKGAQFKPLDMKLIGYNDTIWKEVSGEMQEIDTIYTKYDTIPITNYDSLYSTLVINKYFSSIYNREIKERNKIKFEFLEDEDNMMSYVGENSEGNNATIISNYEIKDNMLYIYEGGVTEIPVVSIDPETGEYYRRLAVVSLKQKYKSEATQKDTLVTKVFDPMDDEVLDIEDALKEAGFGKAVDFKNPGDTVIWCNIKYVYK